MKVERPSGYSVQETESLRHEPPMHKQVPVLDLLWKEHGNYPVFGTQAFGHNNAVLEAYRRGQESVTKKGK